MRGKVRAALAGATNFTEFSDRLSRDGVLVRPRMSTHNPDEVTGYAVALRATGADAAERIEPVWFGGGKLAPDLTFPQLQAPLVPRTRRPPARRARRRHGAGRSGARPGRASGVVGGRRQAIGRADEQLRVAASGDPTSRAVAEAAVVAAGEVLAAVGRLTERSGAGPIHRAAEAYDRAARGLRRRPPT